MARPAEQNVRKVIAFDAATWATLQVLAKDTMKDLQELVDEAVRDLLEKHGRPALLRDALRESLPPQEADRPKNRRRRPR